MKISKELKKDIEQALDLLGDEFEVTVLFGPSAILLAATSEPFDPKSFDTSCNSCISAKRYTFSKTPETQS